MPVTGKEMLQEILHPTRKAMEKQGITVDYLIEKGKKLLGAQKTVYKKVKGTIDPESTETQVVAKTKATALSDSEAVIAINADDLPTQLKQEDMFYKLGGHYPNEKVDHTVNIGMELTEKEAKLASEAVDFVLKQALSGESDEK